MKVIGRTPLPFLFFFEVFILFWPIFFFIIIWPILVFIFCPIFLEILLFSANHLKKLPEEQSDYESVEIFKFNDSLISQYLVREMRIKMDAGDLKNIHRVGEVARNGGVIVYPTDTVLGIGCDPFKPGVVKRVFEIKQRESKPMPVLVFDKDKALEMVLVDSIASKLMDLFWPGALTIVLKERKQMPFELTQGSGKVGVRMPNHTLALKLIEASGGSLVGTSANISGQPAARRLDELDPRVESNVDVVVDGGSPGGGLSSTVIEVIPAEQLQDKSPGNIKVIREGAVKADIIKGMLRESGIGEVEFEGI